MAKSSEQVPAQTAVLDVVQVVQTFTSLVHKIAHGLGRRTTDPVEDLVQVGMIGLLEAHKRYDPTQAASFKTYATHFITGHIRHYLRDKQQLMKGPRALQEMSYRLSMAEKQLKQELNRDPSTDELAAALEMSSQEVQEVMSYQQQTRMLWLDQEMSESDNEKRTLIDTIANDEGSSQDVLDTRIYILEGIEKLDTIDQQLLRLRYFEDLTQADIAGRLDMSQMEVCRKIKQAEKRLKRYLYEFLE